MPAKSRTHYSRAAEIDATELARFEQSRQKTPDRRRKSYSDEQMLAALVESARVVGHSPTIAEYDQTSAKGPHSQTLISRFGSWNEAKRRAGLRPRKGATKAQLAQELTDLGVHLGRTPTTQDVSRCAKEKQVHALASFYQAFGTFSAALQAAGFDVPVGEERLDRAVADGARLAIALGRLPTLQDWQAAHTGQRIRGRAIAKSARPMFSHWQVYRMVGQKWARMQYLIHQEISTS